MHKCKCKWTHCAVLFGIRAMNCSKHNAVDDLVDAVSPGQQSSAACVPERLSITKGWQFSPSSSDLKHWRCCSGVQANPLEDGSFEVIVDQKVLNWQLLCSHLCLPRKQRNEASSSAATHMPPRSSQRGWWRPLDHPRVKTWDIEWQLISECALCMLYCY